MARVKRLRSSRGAMASAFFQATAAFRYWPSRKKIPAAVTSNLAVRIDFGSRSASSTRIASARLYSRRFRAPSSSRRSAVLSCKSERSRGALEGARFSRCAARVCAGRKNGRHAPSIAEARMSLAIRRAILVRDAAAIAVKGMQQSLRLGFWLLRPRQICFPARGAVRFRWRRGPHRTVSVRDKSVRWPNESPATSDRIARPFERRRGPDRIFPEPHTPAREPAAIVLNGDRPGRFVDTTSRRAWSKLFPVGRNIRVPGEPIRRVSGVAERRRSSFPKTHRLLLVGGGPG